MAILKLLGGVFGIGEKWVEGRNQIRAAKIKADIAKWTAKAQAYDNDAQRTNNWEIEALRQSQYSWKDEFWTIILGILLLSPMALAILGVITGDDKYQLMIDAAWRAYAEMPIVIQGLYPFVILASIGIRYKGKSDAANAIRNLG